MGDRNEADKTWSLFDIPIVATRACPEERVYIVVDEAGEFDYDKAVRFFGLGSCGDAEREKDAGEEHRAFERSSEQG
jgi:hypothetical protein